MKADVVTCADAFEALAGEWDQLVEESGRQGYFMRWSWNFLWWKHLAPADAELRLVTCRTADGTLVGLAPLYLRTRFAFGVITVRELLLLDCVSLKTAEYLDIVTRAGYERTGAVAMANAFEQLPDWDRLWCCRVPDDSPVITHFIAALNATATCSHFDEARYIDTSAGWDAYKRSLGRSMRRNVEYDARRLFQSRSCEFNRVDSPEDLDAAFDALVELHTAQWQSKQLVGSLSNEVFGNFLRKVAHESLADHRLRLWTLKIDGSVEAVLLGFLDGGIVHYFQKGHNPAFAKDDLYCPRVPVRARSLRRSGDPGLRLHGGGRCTVQGNVGQAHTGDDGDRSQLRQREGARLCAGAARAFDHHASLPRGDADEGAPGAPRLVEGATAQVTGAPHRPTRGRHDCQPMASVGLVA